MTNRRATAPLPLLARPAAVEACAKQLRALADPTRLAVLDQLARGPQPVMALARSLGVEQSLLSHHLQTLRKAKLVKTVRNGREIVYSLAAAVVDGSAGTALDLGCCELRFARADARPRR